MNSLYRVVYSISFAVAVLRIPGLMFVAAV